MTSDIDLIIEWLEGMTKISVESRNKSTKEYDYNFHEGERVAYINTIHILNMMKAIKGE